MVTFAPEGMSDGELANFDGGCLGDTIDTHVPVWEFAAAYLRAESPECRYLICEDTSRDMSAAISANKPT